MYTINRLRWLDILIEYTVDGGPSKAEVRNEL